MAANMALAAANVTGAGSWEKASVVVRRNRLSISKDGHMLLQTEGVTATERLSATRWRVTADGLVYDIERQRGGCGCARGG